MIEQMKWEDVYEYWKQGSYEFSGAFTVPVSAETVFVEYTTNLIDISMAMIGLKSLRHRKGNG